MSNVTSPAISIVIPMYNVEKYISQCLESVLAQSMQDFEVIVVDDGSTDNSVSIVNDFSKSFAKKLKLIQFEENNGSPGPPRNVGISSASGKYITFLDSDDLFTNTALEELYKIAEETQAQVLHASRFITTADMSETFDANTSIKVNSWESGKPVKNIKIETSKIDEKIRIFCKRRTIWSSWNKLYRRDFLIDNNIQFPNLSYSEDMPFCFKCICLAEKFVRIPNVFYIYRYRQGSIQHRNVSVENLIQMYLTVLIEGFKVFESFMNKFEFFIENPDFKYMVLDFFAQEHISYFDEVYEKFPVHLIDLLIRENLTSIFGENTAFASYFFNTVNVYRNKIMKSRKN